MKLITAHVRNDVLEDLVTALAATGASGMTATEVRMHSVTGERLTYRGSNFPVATIRSKVEIVVDDEVVEEVVRVIMALDRTNDGIAFVLPVTESYRIRTGDWEGDFTR